MQSYLTPDLREPKLPKWAQDALDTLRRKVRDAEQSAREARLDTIPSESDMIIDRYDDYPIGLGKRPVVRVVLTRDDQGEANDWIDVRLAQHYKGTLEILGSGTLRIRPQVTNVINVSITPRGEE